MIDGFFSERHYLDHALPVWQALDPSERGTLYLAGRLADEADSQGLTDFAIGYPPPGDTLCLVSSYKDSQAARTRRRPIAYLEHGAAQTYQGTREVSEHSAYHGSPGHDGTALFLAPRQEVADRWQERYPSAIAVAIGCPKMDAWHRNPRSPAGPLTVAFAFHHQQAKLCPESSSAWPAYSEHLPAAVACLKSEGIRVLGHGHPRIFDRLRPRWEVMSAEPVADLHEVFARAHLLVFDNSSAGWEFCSLGRPVVLLDAPWYRCNVEHGLRFWKYADVGVRVTDPDRLAESVLLALTDPPAIQERRRAAVADIYIACDGRAAERAVEAIRSIS